MSTRVGIFLAAVGLLAGGPARGPAAELPVTSGRAEVAEPVLYYETCGDGEAVVLIHGGNLDRRMWDDQFQTFARRYRVIRYDVRGFGRSDTATRPYSDVKDLYSLLKDLHVQKAHLIGLSLGGRIAIDFTLEHPEMVRSLVAVGPGLGGFAWPAESEERGAELDRLARDRSPEEAVEGWLKDPYMVPAMQNPALAPRVRQLSLDNAHAWLANGALVRRLDPPAIRRLREIRVPTLLVVGDRDVPEIQAIVRILQKGIPHVRKVVIAGAGHLVNMEKPEAFNEAVLGFLGGNSKVNTRNFAKLQAGMSESQVRDILGSPSDSNATATNAKTVTWENGEYKICIFFRDGKALGLQEVTPAKR
jgi:pimeloyl-ACP methyl ester carboxylesterase